MYSASLMPLELDSQISKKLCGNKTRMLRRAFNIPFSAHLTLEEIYTYGGLDIPQAITVAAQRQLHMIQSIQVGPDQPVKKTLLHRARLSKLETSLTKILDRTSKEILDDLKDKKSWEEQIDEVVEDIEGHLLQRAKESRRKARTLRMVHAVAEVHHEDLPLQTWMDINFKRPRVEDAQTMLEEALPTIVSTKWPTATPRRRIEYSTQSFNFFLGVQKHGYGLFADFDSNLNNCTFVDQPLVRDALHAALSALLERFKHSTIIVHTRTPLIKKDQLNYIKGHFWKHTNALIKKHGQCFLIHLAEDTAATQAAQLLAHAGSLSLRPNAKGVKLRMDYLRFVGLLPPDQITVHTLKETLRQYPPSDEDVPAED